MKKETTELELKTHEDIIAGFFQMTDDLHFHHLNTLSFSEHKALQYAYDEISDYKDSVSEQLIGAKGKLSSLKLSRVPSCLIKDLPEDLMELAKTLREYSVANKIQSLVNTSDEIHGVGRQLAYLLRLS